MKLTELLLKHFGKFTEKQIVLEDGLNIICGENESGKTTVHTFLCGMLFGMERGRGRAALSDTFTKYEPWENGGYYAGRMRFSCGGRTFCLDRNFDRQTKRTELFCEDDGEELSPQDGDLEMLLGGLKKSMFEETVGMAQRKPETGETLANELKNYATNCYAAGDQSLQLGDALTLLEERQKELERKERKREQQCREKREEMELGLSYVWRDIHRLNEELEAVQQKIAVRAAEEQDKRQKFEEFYRQKAEEAKLNASRWRVHPVMYVGMAAVIILLFLVLKKPWSFLWAIVLVLMFGMYIWNRMKDGKKPEQDRIFPEEEEPEQPSLEKLSWEEERILAERKEKQVCYENLQEQLAEAEEEQTRPSDNQRQLAAVRLSKERLVQLSDEMRREVGVKLNQRAACILAEVTAGRYTSLWISEALEVSMQFEGKRINMEQVSRGTLEQIYFAVRMAAQEILFEEEFPVILDDAFAYYDDKRLLQTLIWLYENRKQILLFTCQNRERTLLRAAGIPFHEVRL